MGGAQNITRSKVNLDDWCLFPVSLACHAWMHHHETKNHVTTHNDTKPARARKKL